MSKSAQIKLSLLLLLIEGLKEMHKSGDLTKEEYKKAKKKILD